MLRKTITDTYGDTLTVSTYCHEVYLEAEEGNRNTAIVLDRKGAKKLRKALKRFLEGETN